MAISSNNNTDAICLWYCHSLGIFVLWI